MIITIGGYQFDGPVKLNDWDPPCRAGVYAILRYDITASNYPVVYVGESSNMSERGFTTHHALPCWLGQVSSINDLYIATYLMPDSTADERRVVETALINLYHPICNG